MVILKTEEPEAHTIAINILKGMIQHKEILYDTARQQTEKLCIEMVASQNAENTHAAAIEDLTAAINVLRGGA